MRVKQESKPQQKIFPDPNQNAIADALRVVEGMKALCFSDKNKLGVPRGLTQALLGGTSLWDMRQWRGTDAQEVPPEYEKELLYYVGDQALEKVAQRRCGVFLTGDIQEPSELNPAACALR
ncbi:hypothetical protein DUI87_08185 [Hirundo rustica rustica]|uniref:Uncharacterized protein n=1 Tax=Hirundo rustica rustica TaxID=333673 RepID=A0A3M0KRS5_HIRRU|nr:hypothetical protein DUI87_08185 [Hirundo rustica rustica]